MSLESHQIQESPLVTLIRMLTESQQREAESQNLLARIEEVLDYPESIEEAVNNLKQECDRLRKAFEFLSYNAALFQEIKEWYASFVVMGHEEYSQLSHADKLVLWLTEAAKQALAAKPGTKCTHEMCRGANRCVLAAGGKGLNEDKKRIVP